MAKLPTPSEEQQYIIDGFKSGKNIKIIAVAGAGKSSLLLQLATVCKTQKHKVLLVTYNKALQHETEQRIKANRLGTTIASYTIHALAGRVYGTTIRNDEALVDALETMKPKKIYDDVNVLMIDECNDLMEIYQQFLNLLIPNKQLVIVGDPRQCIYAFKNASPKYLINAEKYFSNSRDWNAYFLSTSYRLPPKLGRFIEQHVLRSQVKFVGGYNTHNQNQLHYYRSKSYIDPEFRELVGDRITHYGPQNCIIIIPSFGSNKPSPSSPLGILLDYLTNRISGLQIAFRSNKHVNTAATEANKLIVSTIHGCKGGTWDLSIVFGINETYMKYYDKEWPTRDKCPDVPNPIYVALTRAHELILFDSSDAQPLRTIDTSALDKLALIKGAPLVSSPKSISIEEILSRYAPHKTLSVLDIINFRNVEDVIAMNSRITYKEDGFLDEYDNDMEAPELTHSFDVNGKLITEFVFKYYGICIPILAEYRHSSSYEKLHSIHKLFMVKVIVNRYKFLIVDSGVRVLMDRLEYLVNKHSELLTSKYSPTVVDALRRVSSNTASYEDVLYLYDHIHPTPTSKNTYESDMYRLVKNKCLSLVDIMKQIIYYEEFEYRYLHLAILQIDKWLDHTFIEEGVRRLCKFLDSRSGVWEKSVLYTAQHPRLYSLMKDAQPVVSGNKVAFLNTKPLIIADDCSEYSYHIINIMGSIDFYADNDELMEFKVTLNDDDSHLLQIATYMALTGKTTGTLLNIYTGLVKYVTLDDIPGFISALCKRVPNW